MSAEFPLPIDRAELGVDPFRVWRALVGFKKVSACGVGGKGAVEAVEADDHGIEDAVRGVSGRGSV